MSANSPSETNSDPEKKFSSHRHLIFGWSLAFLLVFGVGGWSAFAELTGAIMASGTIVVDAEVEHAGDPARARAVHGALYRTQRRMFEGVVLYRGPATTTVQQAAAE